MLEAQKNPEHLAVQVFGILLSLHMKILIQRTSYGYTV